MQGTDLIPQVIRHGRSISLVFGINIVTEGLAFGIKYHGYFLGGFVAYEFSQHVDDNKYSMGGLAVRA